MANLFPTFALLCAVLFHPKVDAAGFLTDYVVLLPQARGVIPNAYGPVKAKVAANFAVTLQFSIVAGTGYAAGTVAATTNANGQVVRLTKGRQFCSIAYAAGGPIASVRCATSRRRLEDTPTLEGEAQDEYGTGVEGGHGVKRHLYSADCWSCVSVATSTFSTKLRAVCSTTFYSKVPSQYRWVRSAGAALCAMTSKLGNPDAVAKQTCRCCSAGSDCESGVCSAGVCLAQKLSDGSNCPDGEDWDCENGVCAIAAYKFRFRDIKPSDYVCCPSGTTFDYELIYCTGFQEVGSSCPPYFPQFCKSGICSGGKCLAQKLENGQACPDGEDEDCQSGICTNGICQEWQPGNGEPCESNEDCPNNVCAQDSYPFGDYVCCRSNARVTSDDVFFDGGYYCTETQLDSEECKDDMPRVCTSGICAGGLCADQKSGVGEFCQDGLACASGVCSAGSCLAQKLENGQSCPDHEDEDCQNGACARSSYSSEDYVCCPSNASYSNGYAYCTATTETGDWCDYDELCKTGICVSDECVSQKLANGARCSWFADEDCQNNSCARSSYPSGNYVCCPSNEQVYDDVNNEVYCTATQSVGQKCRVDIPEVCKTGVCSKGICAAY